MVSLSKREVLVAPFVTVFGLEAAARAAGNEISSGAEDAALDLRPGPFNSSVASLETYRTPDWFRDAKFGIWSHWGPQAVAGQGDWYARFMYVPGHPHYDHHVKTYGHPSEFGYKDIIPLWKAEHFDPDALMSKYVAAGAKYFVSMGCHHDNFDLWNSKHHRWNAAVMGPKRDIVGAWRAAARKHGLRFGVSEHLGASYRWWYPNHLYDQFWPKMSVDYDGADPRYADLYHDNRDEPYRGTAETWYTKNPKFHRIWFRRIRDLVDSYQPDLLYSDGGIPFGEEASAARMAEAPKVVLIGGLALIPRIATLLIKGARVPVAPFRLALRPPMGPDAELGIAEPIRMAVACGERLPVRLERSGI
jgi:alpha-L-fucosidase